jgi:hypothetical protein
MPTSLDFSSTSGFRNKLMTRNLKPYTVPGAYTPPVNDVNYPTVLNDFSVIDSPDEYISDGPFADQLYPLNAYGPEGGFLKIIDAGGLAQTRSNLGPYDYSDNKLPIISEPIQREIPTKNKYAPQQTIQLIRIGNIQSVPTFQQYTDPLSFVPSSYSPYQILLQDNPTGDNGSLSQDSFIAQLGSKVLKKEFQERIGRELIQNTVGRINLPNAVGNPVEAIQLLQGKRPLIERDWVITRPSNIALAAVDFAARLGGFYFPGSVIPGDYFTQPQNNLSLFGQIAQAFNGGKDPRVRTDDQGNQRSTGIGKLFGRFFTQDSPSQIFINNTGGGQKSQLYFNLNLNRYSPDYERSIVGEVLDTARKAFNAILDRPNRGGYYVGSKQLEASRIDSPADALANDPFGRQIIAPMYGPDKLGKQYEGPDKRFDFGLNGKSITDNGGDLTGGFVWSSPKYTSDLIKPPFNSTSFDFRETSILDYTQRFVTAADDLNGPNRYSHVGNAINQVSTIFNDGYKQITKGSQIQKWSNPAKGVYNNDNVYCRIFTKDKPYYTFANLQKTDGNIRKFSYSVLDNTYNLNIAPLKNPGSTNIVNGKVKKYMFSIENLAWRTSNRAGLTYEDLPECEKGPNGGRVMWFPPYDLQFSESSKPSFTPVNFLGRPEPLFTYKDTTRSGSLSWKIVVDHPSILNLIVNKELANQQDSTVNQIVDSFIAGCLKFDIYELAKRWNTLRRDQLVDLQKKVVMAKSDEYQEIVNSNGLKVESETPGTTQETVSLYTPPDFSDLIDYAFYFDNDIPASGSESFLNIYNQYIANTNYTSRDVSNRFLNDTVKVNFDKINKDFGEKVKQYFENFPKDNAIKPRLALELIASASAPASVDYNYRLSERRAQSVKTYLDGLLPDFKDQIVVKLTPKGEEISNINVRTTNQNISGNIDCKNEDPSYLTDRKYSIPAMACRRVSIKTIDFTKPDVTTKENPLTDPKKTEDVALFSPTERRALPPKPATITVEEKFKEGIGKAILRSLLTECNYFELLKESDPFFYDSMKRKIKYFSPAFHAITPEGLNSRLTFLQQCTRPGDTIPVIDINGKPKYNNAVNTAFGAPPILILRIGDFFNTKIIPNDIQFAYEPLLDINPEGIGVQPMIVKITLTFNIVGGMGLKEPVQKLQNALSFNYYANTEVYDERAEWTDDSFKQIDEDLKKALFDNTQPPKPEPPKNQNAGGEPIGTIITKTQVGGGVASGSTGETSYTKIMDALYDDGQSYLDTTTNKLDEIFNRYNLQVLQVYTEKSNYIEGETQPFSNPTKTKIIGKPYDFEIRLKDIKEDVEKSINNNENFLTIRLKSLSFTNKTINKVSDKLISVVNREYQNILTELNLVTQKIVETEQKIIKDFAKLDFVVTERDGYIKSNQEVFVYKTKTITTSGDTLTELKQDYKKGSDKLLDYYDILKNEKILEYKISYDELTGDFASAPSSIKPTNTSNGDAKFWIIMSRIFLDDNEYNRMINEISLTPDVVENGYKVNEIIKEQMNQFKADSKKFKDTQKVTFDALKVKLEPFKKWEPYTKGKERKLTYNENEKGNNTDENRLKNIYKQGNSNSDKKTFNGKNVLL